MEPKVPAFLGLEFAQWAVILREVGKTAGFIAVMTGAYSQTDVNSLLSAGDMMLKALQFGGGGLLIVGPMIYQIFQRASKARIKEVAELPTVKGVVTDVKTATAIPNSNVVANPDALKGVTK